MEQRVGRIDRVRSLTDRRLSSLKRTMTEDDKLQVYLPYLQDTVEVFQVRRVLERMNTFLRLMHEGLILPRDEGSRINLDNEAAAGRREVPPLRELLKSAFPCERHLEGDQLRLGVGPDYFVEVKKRFLRLTETPLEGLQIEWDPAGSPGRLFGKAKLGNRKQSFSLTLKSTDGHLLLRCSSPIGRVSTEANLEEIQDSVANKFVHIAAIITSEEKTYNLTVEEDVLLGKEDEHDAKRVAALIQRVVEQANFEEEMELPGLVELAHDFVNHPVKEDVHES